MYKITLFFFLILAALPLVAATEPDCSESRSAKLYSDALRAMNQKDYKTAKESFLLLSKQPDLPPTISEETELQLVEAEIGLGNYSVAQGLINNLLSRPLFPFMGFRVKMLEARLAFAQHQIDKAMRIFKEQESVCPLKDWPLEYRILYATIELLKG